MLFLISSITDVRLLEVNFFFTPVYFSAFVEDNELKSFLEEKGIRF